MAARFFITLIMILLFSSISLAQKTNIIFDADFMEKNNKKNTITLKDNVNVIFQQQHLLADEAIIYEKRKTVIAKGNVTLQTPKTTLRGQKIEFNYETNKGKLYKGVITSGQVLIESDLIEKIGEEEYVAENAYYTACLTCPASWSFTSSKVTAEIGGYAYINSPWLHLLQVPVLPLPYLAVPLNSKRQTGFLVPKISNSSIGGLALEQPYFWAIDRSHDATFSLLHYEKRGFQGFTNYRYVISENSGGELNAAYMKDRVVGFEDRWFLQYKHYYKLPNNYVQRTKIALVSDRKYPREFPEQILYNGEAALDNGFSITRNFENAHLSFDTSYYLPLIEDSLERLEAAGGADDNVSFSPIDKTNKSSLHRLPEINYELMDVKVSDDLNLFFNFNAQYLNISRNDIAFDRVGFGTTGANKCATDADGNLIDADDAPETCIIQPNPDGGFNYGPQGIDPVASTDNYGDLIRTGQRLDMMSTLHAPFWVGKYLDVDPAMSFRYTQYSLGVQSDNTVGYDSFPYRYYAQYDISTKSYFSRVYQWDKDSKIKHSIIPRIDIRYIPEIKQTRNHFFGDTENTTFFREKQPIDDSDLNWRDGGRGIQFDQRDRVIGRQYIDFGLTNKIISRGLNNTSYGIFNQYEQNFLLDISQAYDLREARKGGDGRPWQDLRTSLLFTSRQFTQSVTAVHFPYHGKTRWVTSSRYYFFGNDFVGIDYLQTYRIEQNPPVDPASKQENIAFNTGMYFKYLFISGNLEYDIKQSIFKRWTLATSIKPPGSCWLINGRIEQPLDQPDLEPNISVSMEFQFGK